MRLERDRRADMRVKYYQLMEGRIAFRFSLNFVRMFETDKKSFHFVSFGASATSKISLQKMFNKQI